MEGPGNDRCFDFEERVAEMNSETGSMLRLDGSFDPSGEPVPETGVGQQKGNRSAQPIAIVGMACRFPKAEDLSAFWRLLEAGENGVTEGVPGSGVGCGEMDGAVHPEPTLALFP